jgi:hypothetical protein
MPPAQAGLQAQVGQPVRALRAPDGTRYGATPASISLAKPAIPRLVALAILSQWASMMTNGGD